jgi:hypothetical protein
MSCLKNRLQKCFPPSYVRTLENIIDHETKLLIKSEASSSILVEGLASHIIERQNVLDGIHNEN